MGFDFFGAGDVNDAGVGILLWRDGPAQEYPGGVNAVFHNLMRLKHSMGAFWL